MMGDQGVRVWWHKISSPHLKLFPDVLGEFEAGPIFKNLEVHF